MKKVFIDGSAGTTGLRIRERLAERQDLEVVALPEETRKDPAARKAAIESADVAFLCLPDAAAIEAVELAGDASTVIIDTSTAHRTNDAWAYGFPELEGQRAKIAASKRIANPGCHASGFIALVEPLVRNGILPAEAALTAFSLTGYSGGGKKMIADYETASTPLHLGGRQYALGQTHKHLPEMQKICGLTQKPVFSPILGDFYAGMATTVLLPGIDAGTAWEALSDHYAGQNLISVAPLGGDEPVIYASTYAGKDTMRIQVSGQRDQCMVTAIFDNLGKGASGAAIQNMNLLLGLDETTGLSL